MSSSSSSAAAPSKLSFTVRRPTPVSRAGSSGLDSDQEGAFKVPALPRHLIESGRSTPSSPLANGKTRPIRPAEPDSSDEEEQDVDEIVTGFDHFGVQRLHEKKKDEGPLVIPALPNRDWRDAARKRKASEIYVPAAAAAKTGVDGSVGGLGTTDSISSGPQLSGLVKMDKKMKMEVDEEDGKLTQILSTEVAEETQETEDEKAIRALIASAKGGEDPDSGLVIGAIPAAANEFARPGDETEAYKRDVVTRPESASLEDYARVPVEQFGAALLRGMGWKPGQAASRTRTGPVEPYLPAARPSLLGIGAKEREAIDDGSTKKKATRPERRYIPVIKREREGSGKGSGASSRRSSRSPDPDRRRDREGDGRRDKDRDRDRERERDDRRKDRDHATDRNRHDTSRSESRRDYDSEKGSDRDRERERARLRDDDDRHRDRVGGRSRDYDSRR